MSMSSTGGVASPQVISKGTPTAIPPNVTSVRFRAAWVPTMAAATRVKVLNCILEYIEVVK